MGTLLVRATRSGTLRQIRYVTPTPPAAAHGLVASVYRQVERDFGMLAPPISLHSPAPTNLAAAWAMLRESLLARGHTSRASREAVAAAVSATNRCPYCVDVHGSTLAGLIAAGRSTLDRPFAELTAWAQGEPGPAPFPAVHAPEYFGVAVTFHYLNRMVNIFLPPSPFPPAVRGVARRAAGQMATRLMASLARRTVLPRQSTGLLPAAPLPADLGWAQGHGGIAEAFAAAAHAVDRQDIPDAVRAAAGSWLATDVRPGLSMRGWLDDAVAGVPGSDQPAARLAALTMFASHRVTPQHIADTGLDGAGLIRLTSWAAMQSARHIGARLAARAYPADVDGTS